MTADISDLESSTRFRHFNWEKAKTFYYVTKLGSFTKASLFLRISQSALSRSVLELEQSLGASLFIREARGVKLTRKGEELFSIVENMFLGITSFTRKTYAETPKGKRRKIRIATTYAVTSYMLDTHILEYNQEHPDLVFELVSDDYLIDIVLNDVDLAIRPYDSNVRGVQQELLFTLEKKLFASDSYLEKYGEPQTVQELVDHRLISLLHAEELPFADVNWILKLGQEKNELHEPIFTAASLESLVKAAVKGLGIIGNYEQMEIIKHANLRNILPAVKDKVVEWSLIYPTSLAKDKQILDLAEYLQKKFLGTN